MAARGDVCVSGPGLRVRRVLGYLSLGWCGVMYWHVVRCAMDMSRVAVMLNE